jgi:basic amino acid/polyamine antiporter, APA family
VSSTSQAPATGGATLVRAIGVRALSAGLFNTIVGAGIFVLPAAVAGLVDRGAPYAYLTCAVAIMFTTLCYAAAGSRVVDTGGSYAYIGAAFGPLAGFLGGVMVWLSDVLATAGVASAFAAGVALYVPAIGSPVGRMALVVGIIGGLAVINLRGLKQGARLMELVTIAKLAPLVLFIAVGLVLRRHDLPVPELPSGEALGRATLLLMFAFSGAESPLALLYGLIHLVAQATLGTALATSNVAPLSDAANILAGSSFRTMMLLGTLLSMLGYLSAVALATPRTLFALSGDGILPALRRVHPRLRTPHIAIVFHVAVLVLYLSVALASWELQRRDVRAGHDVFNVPAIVPLIASAFCLWLMWHASRTELMLEAIVMAAATALYVVRRFTSTRS